MRRLAAVWPDAEKVQTLSAQIGWSHHQVLLDAWAELRRPERLWRERRCNKLVRILGLSGRGSQYAQEPEPLIQQRASARQRLIRIRPDSRRPGICSWAKAQADAFVSST
jgi:hypothetical protein